jgi:hypothetical protein
MGVYVKVPRAEQRKCNGKIIKTRLIDTNERDATEPFRTDADDALYASTPPLEDEAHCQPSGHDGQGKTHHDE